MGDERIFHFRFDGNDSIVHEEEFDPDTDLETARALVIDGLGLGDPDDYEFAFEGAVLEADASLDPIVTTPDNRLIIKRKGAPLSPQSPPASPQSAPASPQSAPASPQSPPASPQSPPASPPADDPVAPPPPDQDVPHFKDLPEYPEDEIPPWAMPFDEAVADLADAGYDVVDARKALELAGSLELAELLLESKNVTAEGLAALNAGESQSYFLDGDDADRVFKGIFDDRESVEHLKAGNSVECEIPDGKGGILTFVFTPKDADTILQGILNKSLANFQPGEEILPNLKPFPLPEVPPPPPPMGLDAQLGGLGGMAGFPGGIGQGIGQGFGQGFGAGWVPPPAPPEPRVENPGYAKIRADPESTEIFPSLSPEHQEALATLVDEFNVPFLQAFEQFSNANQDLEDARALLMSLRED
jgi:hypothetical protein